MIFSATTACPRVHRASTTYPYVPLSSVRNESRMPALRSVRSVSMTLASAQMAVMLVQTRGQVSKDRRVTSGALPLLSLLPRLGAGVVTLQDGNCFLQGGHAAHASYGVLLLLRGVAC